jgi:hypothetical protein
MPPPLSPLGGPLLLGGPPPPLKGPVPLLGSPLDAPPNSLIDSNANPKMNTTKGTKVCSFAHSTSKVKGHVGALKGGLRQVENVIIHTNLYKPNNKLVSAYL